MCASAKRSHIDTGSSVIFAALHSIPTLVSDLNEISSEIRVDDTFVFFFSSASIPTTVRALVDWPQASVFASSCAIFTLTCTFNVIAQLNTSSEQPHFHALRDLDLLHLYADLRSRLSPQRRRLSLGSRAAMCSYFMRSPVDEPGPMRDVSSDLGQVRRRLYVRITMSSDVCCLLW